MNGAPMGGQPGMNGAPMGQPGPAPERVQVLADSAPVRKTALGISAGFVGAFLYLAGLFSGYVVLAIAAGYVLLKEKDQWLRRTAVKAIALTLVFSVIYEFVGLVPEFMSFLSSIVHLFKGSFDYNAVSNLVSIVQSGLKIAESIVFLYLGIGAFRQKESPMGAVEKSVDRHMLR